MSGTAFQRRKMAKTRAWRERFVHPARLLYGEWRAVERGGSRIGGKAIALLEVGDPCYLCNGPRHKKARDHIEPQGAGRPGPQFTVPCCWSCNTAKADAPLLLYLAQRAHRRTFGRPPHTLRRTVYRPNAAMTAAFFTPDRP